MDDNIHIKRGSRNQMIRRMLTKKEWLQILQNIILYKKNILCFLRGTINESLKSIGRFKRA